MKNLNFTLRQEVITIHLIGSPESGPTLEQCGRERGVALWVGSKRRSVSSSDEFAESAWG